MLHEDQTFPVRPEPDRLRRPKGCVKESRQRESSPPLRGARAGPANRAAGRRPGENHAWTPAPATPDLQRPRADLTRHPCTAGTQCPNVQQAARNGATAGACGALRCLDTGLVGAVTSRLQERRTPCHRPLGRPMTWRPTCDRLPVGLRKPIPRNQKDLRTCRRPRPVIASYQQAGTPTLASPSHPYRPAANGAAGFHGPATTSRRRGIYHRSPN